MDPREKHPGKLFVLSGPSGAGKGTICKKLLEETEKLELSVSMTTRSPRHGEVEGISYFHRKRGIRRTYPLRKPSGTCPGLRKLLRNTKGAGSGETGSRDRCNP